MTPSLEHTEETIEETSFPSHVTVCGNPQRASLQRMGSSRTREIKISRRISIDFCRVPPQGSGSQTSHRWASAAVSEPGSTCVGSKGAPPATRKLGSAARVASLASWLPSADSRCGPVGEHGVPWRVMVTQSGSLQDVGCSPKHWKNQHRKASHGEHNSMLY